MNLLPITLEGDHLGKRHQYLNKLVNEAFKNNVPFETIRDAAERSAIDRLFKIDLAAKYRHVDYTLQTLKDEDMLYVSRAMKESWLLQSPYVHIINPVYLEQELFPQMRTNAVNKMKQWIQINLKDETRCQQFYEYYKKEKFSYALKFLPNTSVGFIFDEMEDIPLDKITAQLLKLLGEKSATAAEMYFKKLEHGSADAKHVTNMQMLLKYHPVTYFYIIENFFLKDFKRLNRSATKYIMKNHKHRFEAKPELYAHRILHLPTLAESLDSEKIKDLIITLARARYLKPTLPNQRSTDETDWLTYEFVRPLMKKIDVKERSEFGKKIFKDKQYGEPVTIAPYLIPTRPLPSQTKKPKEINYEEVFESRRMMLCSARGGGGGGWRLETALDKLFNEFRFQTFEPTFAELRKRIKKESSADNRRDMILVLVSKTGGRDTNVERLLEYLLQKHINEPIHFRAAIVRSLVKRAFVWRFPTALWHLLLKYGHDLGLDGSPTSAECKEGIHAALLRHIFQNTECPQAIWESFLRNFTTLKDYKLSPTESLALQERLPRLLLKVVYVDAEKATMGLTHVCDFLDAYKLDIETFPEVIDAIMKLAQGHPEVSKPLLLRLFKAHVARKKLYKEYFALVQTDASYVNALRHDITLLNSEKFEALCQYKNNSAIHNTQSTVQKIPKSSRRCFDESPTRIKLKSKIKSLHHNQFLKKLALYFAEDGGLALQYLKILETNASANPKVMFSRPLAILTAARKTEWPELKAPEDKQLLKAYYMMWTSLKSNSHWIRPRRPLLLLGSQDVSLAALANWIQTCSPTALQQNLDVLLQFPRHARLVLALRAQDQPGLIARVLPVAAQCCTMRTTHIALRILRRHPHSYSPEDWQALKTVILNINFKNKKYKSCIGLAKINSIPKQFLVEYCVILSQALRKFTVDASHGNLRTISIPIILCITDHIDEVGVEMVTNITKEMVTHVFTADFFKQHLDYENERARDNYYYNHKYFKVVLMLVTQYLITSNTELDLKKRYDEVFIPFAKGLREVWNIGRIFSIGIGVLRYFSDFTNHLQSIEVFLRPNDHSLPILEAIQSLVDELSPMSENFGINRSVPLVILFRKAIKQVAMDRPELFQNGKVLNDDSYREICLVLGKLVAQDVEDMTSRYFPLVRSLYAATFLIYLRKSPGNLIQFLPSILNGLFEDLNKENALMMGLNMYNSVNERMFNKYDYEVCDIVSKTIANSKSEKLTFFKDYADICDCMGMNGCLTKNMSSK